MSDRVCAIHQPNMFPRISTMAKLYAADVWVVLDDVQFNPRDYQHRARLVDLHDTSRQQWLTLPVHKPYGRASRIDQVLVIDSHQTRRRLVRLPQQYYGRSPYWPEIATLLEAVLCQLTASEHLARVAEASTSALLDLAGWHGTIVRSSTLRARQGRSVRLAELTSAVGAQVYLCGTGGARYLDEQPFAEHGLTVRHVRSSSPLNMQTTRRATGLHALAALGRSGLQARLHSHSGHER